MDTRLQTTWLPWAFFVHVSASQAISKKVRLILQNDALTDAAHILLQL